MQSASAHLAPAFQDLDDAVNDFRDSDVGNATHRFARFVHVLESEPLRTFFSTSLPTVDLETWLRAASGAGGSVLGSGGLPWPFDRPSSVAMRIAYTQAIGSNRLNLFNVLIEHFRDGKSPQVVLAIFRFADSFLAPLVRDITRLAADRPFTSALSDLLGGLPQSGDATLDSLLGAAIGGFRDAAPAAQAQAVEKLWDAWERLKTLDDETDKKASVKRLLDGAASDVPFRALLETEAVAVTAIGNAFQIRHFETNKTAIARPEQLDYLFHRLLALITLLMASRARAPAP